MSKPESMLLVVAVLSTAGGACHAPRQSAPMVRVVTKLDTPAKRHGELVFMRHCNQCHPGGEGGLGPFLNGKPAPAAAVKLVIALGPGEMPSFKDKLSAEEVDAVAEYVVALRKTESDRDDEAERRHANKGLR